jgi:hypothetical protein
MTSILESKLQELFKTNLHKFESAISDDKGEWTIRGFVDTNKNVYPMTSDTKVVSKVLEMLLMPVFVEMLRGSNLMVQYAEHQNHYPDLTVVDEATGSKVAVDLKSTYFTGLESVNGFTLGAFTGYFRERESTKNILYPYSSYEAHLVLGVIYEKQESTDGMKFHVSNLDSIPSIARNFKFIFQPKWALATDRPGSGNTKNIGSVNSVSDLVHGAGPFSKLKEPEKCFNDYWMNYLTADMARALKVKVPYRNLSTYLEYKKLSSNR